ncbi:endonuclease/exonuclease/phosphatase family protein [Runella slithyformis]|uniref:Endonuclease/exonuclease/phosphatase n=1 Tax=Runella slithyformis (strain ATCC 29530 / DSM 19594 / LMG 11500 / NCIMB 11436 / LSU 4) TaxID=761193 RepID=A0A7U3ZHH0_RUNSL|nr:endonuclease/exonuclease/phosphatase family protein [Runella slithyformis]AEI47227.1 Endonuclease/exonuclease/phosphatase [Runella slithyformis DSM 19594]
MRAFSYLFLWMLGWFVGGSAYAQKPKPTPVTLKVMTFNIHHGENTLGKTNLTRVVELIKKHKPDLVALQEIDSGAVRSGKLNQMRILSLLSGYEEAFGKTIDFQGGKYGLGILSAHPIEAVQRLKLPNPDSTEPRLLMCALIELPNNKYVRFCTTHLDHRSPLNRGLQAAVINENLQNSLYPVIVGGDFNATAEDHTLEAMTKYWNDAGANTPWATYPGTGKRIDYFWTHKESTFKVLDYVVLYEPTTSDHQPVIVTYSFEK